MDPLALEEERIAVDAMGGDHAPGEIVRGVAMALREADGFRCLLVGDDARIRPLLAACDHPPSRVEIVHTDDAIAMGESAKEAVLARRRASIMVAARLLARDEAEALVSAGNTGALILSAAAHVPMIPGTSRAGLAALLPTRRKHPEDRGFVLLIDVGATIHVSPRDLAHFATMGSAYLRTALGVTSPRVALLNIGEEATKGGAAHREAYQILSRMKDLRFVGNIEGKDIPAGGADVVACDGFTGNVVLKMYEGVAETAINLTQDASRMNIAWRLGVGLLRPALGLLARKTDFAEHGGAPILGFRKLAVKAHGRSRARAIRSALLVTHEALRNDVVGRITGEISRVNETFLEAAPEFRG
jgi:glycerol-3-phosphate acyltransferase PlsX